jgi:hypothetical protein
MKLLRITLLMAVLTNLTPEVIHLNEFEDPNKAKGPKQAKSFDDEKGTKAKCRTEFAFTRGEAPIRLPVTFKGREFFLCSTQEALTQCFTFYLSMN